MEGKLVDEWNNLLSSLTEKDMQWIKNNEHNHVVIDLFHLDNAVSIQLGGFPEAGHVVLLERILIKIKKLVKLEQHNE